LLGGVVSVLVLVLVEFLGPLDRVVSAGCKRQELCERDCKYKCVYGVCVCESVCVCVCVCACVQ
jgi:hypothetical protein